MATGSIRERESKKGECYQIIVETEPDSDTGKRNRIYKTVYGNKKEAEKVMREMLHQIDNNAFIKNNDTTLKDFIEEWLNVYIIPHKAATTTHYYIRQLQRYIYPTIGNIKLQQLKTIDIQKLYNQLKIKSTASDKPLSGKTIKNIHMNIRAALDKAVEQEIISKNPAVNVEMPKVVKYKADVFNKEEIKELFEAVKNTDLELAVHILIFLGLRRGELIALRWSNVNLEKGTVNIIENIVKVKQEIIIKDPKELSRNNLNISNAVLRI